MSGDVQPRKRKDKKKKKDILDDGDPILEKLHVPTFNNNTLTDDTNIHVHKEGGTGGGICAKLVFFILFSALAFLIGLIITEHRGLTDIETVDPNSKFSQLFEGWVDTKADSHDDHDLENHESLEDDDHEKHDDHDDHDDHEDHDENEDDEYDDDISEEVEKNHSEEEEEEEEEDDNLDNESEENLKEDEADDEDEEDISYDPKTKEENEIPASEEEEEEEDDEQDQEVEEDEQDQEVEEDNEVDADNEREESDEDEYIDKDDNIDEEDNEIVSREKRYISEETLDNKDDDDDKDDNEANDGTNFDKDDEEDQIESSEKETQAGHIVSREQENTEGSNENEDKDNEAEIKKTETKPEEQAKDGSEESSGMDKTAEKIESDSEKQSDDDYEYTNITNEDDYKIRQEIDDAHSSIKNNNAHAIALFDNILQKFPSSPRSLYGKALALDHLAEKKKSNEILERALEFYENLLKTKKVPVALFHLAANRCINRWRFLGQYKNAIKIHKIIIDKFPNDPKHLNNLAVTYLTINRVEEARTIFKQVLMKWPGDGLASVHYGFILKTTDNNLEKAVRYLEKGIRSKDEGVIDGRFYFHLGDALTRLGRSNDALKIYEEGTSNKVFLSKYQRSLYNVPQLSAKSWWLPEDLSYSKSLKLLVKSWEKIKEEGVAILNEKGYFQDESENLKDTGEWKQFELYARGQKNIKNCKKCPFTCSIIDQIPEAKSCRRGQTKFSVMHPGTHVWPHCGPTNCRLRVHLGLKVPVNTFIRVGEETKSWKEGDLLIFDDSFEHEVWHNGTGFRLILIVDVWHPELTPSERNSLSPI